MIVEMKAGASQAQLDAVIGRARSLGFDVQLNIGTDKVVVAILGSNTGRVPTDSFAVIPGVESVTRIMRPYKLASREFRSERTVVHVGSISIGGDTPVVMAGPCSVESLEQMLATAESVKASGATVLRGGAYKPRSSPFSFQGLGAGGLEILRQVKERTGMPVVTEVMDPRQIEEVAEVADILQVGARNMQNFALLRELGRSRHPVVLKRGLSATIEEWLETADYLLAEGNEQVILCERGIRTFETATRFTLDISAIGVVKRYSHLPILVDPSHAAGHYELVPSLAKAALAAGADGLIIEVHPNPVEALSDGLQSLTFSDFARLMTDLGELSVGLRRPLKQSA
ncbi:MAG: 3-deoxy-7-phosphoheptulonate synthase [Anaerolineae bacterium]|nr:3-deoxy-7-phosphoheptulonate synthase [Anaerolineae bacterium]